MDAAELHRRAVGEFAERLDAVGSLGSSGAWQTPTPCAGWDVRALVNHIVNEDRWTAPLLAGATIAEVGDRFDGDLLGDDPVGAFAIAGAEATDAAVNADPSMIVHLSFGDDRPVNTSANSRPTI
ncbi:MAG TPA: maleylpyruvate isomerase N-terminal domain-containing protein [Micromonosporaceae bacterium]